jgi:hypothetical protein
MRDENALFPSGLDSEGEHSLTHITIRWFRLAAAQIRERNLSRGSFGIFDASDNMSIIILPSHAFSDLSLGIFSCIIFKIKPMS